MNEENVTNLKVVKRSGKKVDFDGTKIAIAIKKGFDNLKIASVIKIIIAARIPSNAYSITVKFLNSFRVLMTI